MSSIKYLFAALIGLPLFACAETTPTLASSDTREISAYVMQLNTLPLHNTAPITANLDLWAQIRRNFSMQEVSPETVRRFETFYAQKPEYFNRMVRRGSPYLYHIMNEVGKRHMPGEIALLPFVESAFVTHAKSHVGASGIWQFMPKTGKNYGLTQNNWYDGRNDIYAATDAALDYLQYLHDMFGDWSLALAAYNCGEGCVQRAQTRAEKKGLTGTFENLDLPRETREYVPKLLAVRNLVEDPSAFDISLKNIENQPYFEAVKVNQPIDLSVIARLAGISENELISLNPGYKIPVWVPQNGRKLLLPKAAVASFRANLRKADPNTLLSWQPYRVADIHNLTEIAGQYGMDVALLKKANNLRGDHVPRGSILLVSRNTNPPPVAIQTPDSVISTNDTRTDYVVKTAYTQPALTGDTAATENPAWNEPPRIVAADSPTQGRERTRDKPAYGTLTIKKGMTLSQVAQRSGMSIKELKTLNRLSSGNLKPGQVLKITLKTRATEKKDGNRMVKTSKIKAVKNAAKKGSTIKVAARHHHQ